jgi:maleate isomerase
VAGGPAGRCGVGAGVGVIVPYDFALDREIWRWAAAEADLFVTRTRHYPLSVDVELAEQLSTDEALRVGTRDVLAVEPDVVLYLCTSGSFVRGVEGERRMREVMAAAGAPVAVTTSGALLDGLRHLGVHDVAVASPYLPSLGAHLDAFLRAAGFGVVSHHRLGLDRHIWRVPRSAVRDLVLAADRDAAEAVFISCTNLPTYDVIAELEAVLGKPVLSANQVSLWSALRHAGATPPDTSQILFRRP